MKGKEWGKKGLASVYHINNSSSFEVEASLTLTNPGSQ